MPRNTHLIELRNSNLKKRYHHLSEKHKQWRNSAILEQLENEFYLAKRTIEAILNEEAPYRTAN